MLDMYFSLTPRECNMGARCIFKGQNLRELCLCMKVLWKQLAKKLEITKKY
jgi:hypothetical protein